MKTLLGNATVVTMDEQRRTFDPGYVLVEDQRICAVGPRSEMPDIALGTRVLDLPGRVIIPGLVNLHNHPCASFLKATGHGLCLEDWVPQVALPMVGALDQQMLEIGAAYEAAEMLLSGTTTCFRHLVNDNDLSSFESIVKPAAEIGIRQVVAKELRHAPSAPLSPDRPIPTYSRTLEQELDLAGAIFARWEGALDGLVRVALAIEAGANWLLNNATSTQLIVEGHALAITLGCQITNHVSATPTRSYRQFLEVFGCGEVEFLDRLGVLSDRWLLVHAVNLQQREVRRLAEAASAVVHCPVSNAYCGCGVAATRELLQAGVRCGLGSDGTYVCGRSDMFEVMQLAVLIQGAVHCEPGRLSPELALELATIRGAEALGMSDTIGSIESGKRADLAVLDLKRLASWPVIDRSASLVFAARSDNIEHVFVNGRHVVIDGRLADVDISSLIAQAEEASQRLVERANLEWLRSYRTQQQG